MSLGAVVGEGGDVEDLFGGGDDVVGVGTAQFGDGAESPAYSH